MRLRKAMSESHSSPRASLDRTAVAVLGTMLALIVILTVLLVATTLHAETPKTDAQSLAGSQAIASSPSN